MGFTLPAHGPWCQGERAVSLSSSVSALGWYLMRYHLPHMVPGSVVSSSEMSQVSSDPQLEGPLSNLCVGMSDFSADSMPFPTAGAQAHGFPSALGPEETWGFLSHSHSRTHPCLHDCCTLMAQRPPLWYTWEVRDTVPSRPSSSGLKREAASPQGLGLQRQKARLLQMHCKL